MEWHDRGIVLSVRKHGETSAIVNALTREHGRHAGLVRGGTGRRARGVYQPGNMLRLTWRARIAEHLGTWTGELSNAIAAGFLNDPRRLATLASAVALVDAALPEREPHPRAFDGLEALLQAVAELDEWMQVYIRWEVGLLGELGFGLDLDRCAATGGEDELIYVSPKTGRAVSAAAGAPYRDRLLPLPAILRAGGAADPVPEAKAVKAALKVTGHFLDRHVFAPRQRGLPAARNRLIDGLGPKPTTSSV